MTIPNPLTRMPPAAVVTAARRALSIELDEADLLGSGEDGLVFTVRPERSMVVKFSRQDHEALITDVILRGQLWPARETNVYRVLFPAVIAGLIVEGDGKPWYVTLREDIEPVEEIIASEQEEYGGRRARTLRGARLQEAADALDRATEGFFDSSGIKPLPRTAQVEALEGAIDALDTAERAAPAEMRGLRRAIESMMDRGVLLFDMHSGNWGLRRQNLPQFPPPGRFVAIDYGRSGISDPELLGRARRLARLQRVETNPARGAPDLRPFAAWRRVRA